MVNEFKANENEFKANWNSEKQNLYKISNYDLAIKLIETCCPKINAHVR